MKTILLVDDEQRMLDLLSLYIIPLNYRCIKVTSGIEAITFLKDDFADLVILDVMMPEMDGWQTCNTIREFSDVPIMLLTARNDKMDIIKSLKHGADDYVTKPFHEEELLARIEALIRRSSFAQNKKIKYKGLVWDEDAFEIRYLNKQVPLTPKEFQMVGLFLRNPNKVFSRENLLNAVWIHHIETDDRTIDSHIRNIRDKMRNAGFPIDETLTTVWGKGYRWSQDLND